MQSANEQRTVESGVRLILTIAACVTLAAACELRPAAQTSGPVIVVLETEKGRIEIEVETTRAPITAGNFLKYVDAGLYDGGAFHRTVRPETEDRPDVPIQVIQASMNASRRAERLPAIPLERTSVTGVKHVDGAVSMARSVGPDTASNEFFICIGDQPLLDFGGKRNADGQGFAAFGRVIAGMEVVKTIQAAPVAQRRPRGGAADAPSSPSQNLMPPIRILKAYRKGRPGTAE